MYTVSTGYILFFALIMKKVLLKVLLMLGLATPMNAQQLFTINNPDYRKSPHTGMTRQHWKEAALFMLDGAFSYVNNIDDPMKFPKQHEITYPRNEGQI